MKNLTEEAETTLSSILSLPPGEDGKAKGGLRIKGNFKRNLPGKPLVTIITVVLNGDKYIEDTIKSVINQDYDNTEYIIIDGGSGDDTMSIVKKYENNIDYWISEKDNGLYSAMNKGIKTALGTLIGIINAGDKYGSEAVSKVVECFKSSADSNPGIFSGGMKKIDQNGNDLYVIRRSRNDLKRLGHEMSVDHVSIFVHKDIYMMHGVFNEKFRISGDYELMRRFYYKNVPFYFIDYITAVMSSGGVSERLGTTLLRAREWTDIQFSGKTGEPACAFYLRALNLFARSIVKRAMPWLFKYYYKIKYKGDHEI